ncbi:MAG: nucleotidyltransferase family protein [Pseudomonadota bacterium]
MNEILTFYYNSRFDGVSKRLLLNCSDDFIKYIISILIDKPLLPPKISLETWMNYLSYLDMNQLSPYFHLKVMDKDPKFHPPQRIMKKIKEQRLCFSANSMLANRQLTDLFKMFQEEKGLKALVFKGAIFDTCLYPKPGLRPFSDIDLLIHPNDYEQFKKCMFSLGYTVTGELANIRDIQHEETFINTTKKNQKPIDLHWRLNYYPGILKNYTVEDAFSSSVSIGDMRTFNLPDSFIHIVIHTLFTHEQDIKMIALIDSMLLLDKILLTGEFSCLVNRSKDINAWFLVKKMINLLFHWGLLNLPRDLIDEYEINLETKGEKKKLKYITQRHRNPFNWLFVRFPRSFGIFKSFILLIRYSIFRYKRLILKKKLKKIDKKSTGSIKKIRENPTFNRS